MSTFDHLSEAIRTLGGTVTSAPGTWPLKLDVPPTQAEKLTVLLQQAGWTPRPCGSTTRIGHDGFSDVLIFELGRTVAQNAGG
jgi:hypothetical protein